MQGKLIENLQISAGFVPVDMQTTANAGDWFNMKPFRKVLAVLYKAAGTAGDDPVITLEQATSNAGAGNKPLNFTTVYSKVGTLTGVGQFTKITQASANTYEDETSAEAQAIIAIEIDADDLDTANGFTHIQMSVADVGSNAQLGCVFYLGVPRIAQEIVESSL